MNTSLGAMVSKTRRGSNRHMRSKLTNNHMALYWDDYKSIVTSTSSTGALFTFSMARHHSRLAGSKKGSAQLHTCAYRSEYATSERKKLIFSKSAHFDMIHRSTRSTSPSEKTHPGMEHDPASRALTQTGSAYRVFPLPV